MEPTTPPEEPWSPALFHTECCDLRCDHDWYIKLRDKYELHPTVQSMLIHQPVNFKQLAAEWPHVSDKDPMRLAYTRSIKDGEANRQLVTSIGKYLSKHWATVPDHTRRDALALYTPDTFKLVYTIPEMVMAANFGPLSCMCWDNKRTHRDTIVWLRDKENNPEPDWSAHPYSCYDPKYGWHVAVRYSPTGSLDGRAVCLTFEGENMFVRTFMRHKTEPRGYSHTDQALQAWLQAQGYKFIDGWPDGALLTTYDIGYDWQAPYLDGDVQRADYHTTNTLTICSDGEYSCANTDGTTSPVEAEDDNTVCCEACGDSVSEDDMLTVGRDADTDVCRYCLTNDYIQVRAESRNGNMRYINYYIRDDDAVKVKGHSYYIDPDHPPEDVVQLDNEDWAEESDTVFIGNSYYLTDDPDVVETARDDADGSCFALREDCWQHADGRWFRDDIDYETVDDKNYLSEEVNEDGELIVADTQTLELFA